jgi:hypothetical protein
VGADHERRDLSVPIRWHADDPDLLVQAIGFTARQTGFNPRLVEKDYFCSVVLEHLVGSAAELIFKGGTCLAKIHGSFYRLSEDLDFSISAPAGTSRAERSRRAGALKAAVGNVPKRVPGLELVDPLRGANQSTQYAAVVAYRSHLDSRVEPIGLEVGLREPILTAPHRGLSNTMLVNPLSGKPLVVPFPVACLSYREAMAEKLRAALTRREVAIRDYFDVDHAARQGRLAPTDHALLDLLRSKLRAPGTAPVDVSPARIENLRSQLEAELRPVLREQDFAQFDLERAVQMVRTIAERIG